MLKLIIGRQKCGKTHYCLNTLKSAVDNGEKVILLVPEQSSFVTQKLTLETFGPKISNKIEIHSFTSICEAICSVYGGLAGQKIDDGIRFMLVSQAVKNVRNNLKIYAKYVNSTPFIKQILSTVTEMKQSKITAEKLSELSNTVGGSFSDKLHDISLILATYDSLLGNRFLDPLDLIENTVSKMNDNTFFKDKTVVIDDFKGFTESQYSLIERIVAGCKDVYITLCMDSLKVRCETDVFKNIKKCAARLISIAENHAVTVDKPLLLNEIFGCSEDIIALDESFSENNKGVFDKSAPNISVCKADTVYDEIDFCLSNIRRLVREENYRYRDIVIISRNDNGYSAIIDDVSKSYDVPVLIDHRISCLNLPLTVFVLKAVKSAFDFNTENILSFIKTGLTGISNDEINLIENYVYIWNIDGKKWLDDWSMPTKGLNSDLSDEQKIYAEKKEIEHLNSVRVKLIKPLEKLKNFLKGTAEDMCRAIIKMFEDYSVIENLGLYTQKLEQNGKLQEAEYQRAGYDALIKTFDKINTVFGDREISSNEFFENLSVALSYETVGEIPQTQDQVIYGIADRIRPMRPKVAFIIGANQDVFPATVADVGLLTQTDRDTLILNGLSVSDHFISDCIDEKFLFYFALTTASEKVFISYSSFNSLGSSLEPSVEVLCLQKNFGEINLIKYGKDFSLYSSETKEASFRKLAEHFNDESDGISDLKAYFSQDNDYKTRYKALLNFVNADKPSISHESAEKLYGSEILLSPSKADSFAGCKFMYFCKYGLKAGKLEKAEFNPITRGNIVHFCLEHFVNNHLNNIGHLNDNDIKNEVLNLSQKYLNENGVDKTEFDEKFSYLFEVVVNTTVFLAQSLNREFAVSSYSPKFCELKVGDGEAVKGIDVLTDNGKRVTLRGTVDRVDTTADGNVRVIDYKTGSKGDGLKISELIDGQNMQMLLYLYALIKNGQDLIKANRPTAVLYFPAKREFSNTQSDYIKMHGIVLEDPEIVKQMEPDGRGKIAPVTLYPNGASFYKSDSLISEEAFGLLFRYLELLLKRIGNSLTNGDISPEPLNHNDKLQCEFCDYRSICRTDVYKNSRESTDCKRDEALEIISKELGEAENGN